MKNIYCTLLLVSLFAIHFSYAQIFTKITTGVVVTTAGDSRSVNWIDYDNDHFLDLMITNGSELGSSNYLYHNNGDGTFSKVTGDPIVSGTHPSDGATWADCDSDGDLDCFIANWYNKDNLFYVNDGDGTFTQNTDADIANDVGYSETASWGDYNNDGYVDLYVTNSEGGKKNFLYLNNGDLTFNQVTTGSQSNDAFTSRSVNWIDYDQDGDVDLFVTNENNEDENLYRNDAGVFTAITTGGLVTDGGSTMSSSWGDYDNDGDMDVYLANAPGNDALFRNDGGGSFTKITTGPVSNDGGYTFGSNWGDVDNDGDLDLFATNAFYGGPWNNNLYLNNGDGTFTKNTTEVCATDSGWSYGCAFGDYDNDGDLDLAVANCYNASQEHSLYNNNGNSNSWINIQCVGVISNRSAIGATIKLKATIGGQSVWQMRDVSAQSGYCGQNQLNVHFGLGDAIIIDSIVIQWPSGMTDMYVGISKNDFRVAIEGQGMYGVGISPVNNNGLFALQTFPNPFTGFTTISFHNSAGAITIVNVLNLDGRLITILTNDTNGEGIHEVIWNGKDSAGNTVPAGSYIIQLVSSDGIHSRPVIKAK